MKLQLKINERIFCIEAESTNREDWEEPLAKHIARNNETIESIFFAEIRNVCSECGTSLNLDEEQEDGICVQCAEGIIWKNSDVLL